MTARAMVLRTSAILSLACLSMLCLVGLSVGAEFDRPKLTRDFKTWVAHDFRPYAISQGVAGDLVDREMARVTLRFELSDLLAPGEAPPSDEKQMQAEFSAPARYFDESRLAGLARDGRAMASQHAEELSRIEAKYGVPGAILLAIWGRETGYGRAKLTLPAIDVIATRAFMSARRDLFRDELVAALKLVARGIPRETLMGSAAGALGQPQFMPSSYLKYAVSLSGQRNPDIWTSVADSLASMANFLVQSGWKRDRGWFDEITLPDTVSCRLEGPDRPRPLGDWGKDGVRLVSGETPKGPQPAMLLAPAGRLGPVFLASPNAYVIKAYNNSDLYALFVGTLAERIEGKPGRFRAEFRDPGPLLRSDIRRLQTLLAGKGADVGTIDGLPGFKTRRSIGDWQKAQGKPETCFPDKALIRSLP